MAALEAAIQPVKPRVWMAGQAQPWRCECVYQCRPLRRPKSFNDSPPGAACRAFGKIGHREKFRFGDFQRAGRYPAELPQDETGHVIAGKLRLVEEQPMQHRLFRRDDARSPRAVRAPPPDRSFRRDRRLLPGTSSPAHRCGAPAGRSPPPRPCSAYQASCHASAAAWLQHQSERP